MMPSGQPLGLGVTVLSDTDTWGWTTALEQDGWSYVVAPQPQSHIAVTSGAAPPELASWVEGGGVLVVDDADGRGGLIPPPSRRAVVSGFDAPEDGSWVCAPGPVALFEGDGSGAVRVHEDRVVKHGLEQGRYSLVHHRRVGRGHVVWSGMPLTTLLAAHGDRLRAVAPWSPVTERASAVDKAGVAETLAWMVRHAASLADLPTVRRAGWPGAAPSVFVLRVDVDGVYGDRARLLGAVAESLGVRATFFLNRELAERHPGDLGSWLEAHDVGQHADLHDLYDEPDADLRNVRSGEVWVRELTGRTPVGFVAPRGLWSPSLDRALAELGYAWSSDFGLASDARPFEPGGPVLQFPVHAYSPERAVRWAAEQGAPPPEASDIADHYLRVLDEHVRRGRPVHVYGHPEVLGAVAAEVLPPLVRRAEQRGLAFLTLDEAVRWWRRREATRVHAHWRHADGRDELYVQRTDEEVAVEIRLPKPTRLFLDGTDHDLQQGDMSLG